MGRPNLGGGAKRNVITARLTDAQMREFDRRRGPQSRSAYLRALLVFQSRTESTISHEPAEDATTAE